MRRWSRALVVGVAVALLAATGSVEGLGFTMQRGEECFDFYIPAETTVMVTWVLMRGDSKGMSVRLFESAGTPAEADFADEGVEFVTEEAGFHTVCFRNKGADEKVISFEIEMEDSLHLADPLDIMMGSTLHNIETILEDVTTVQKQHKYREGRQRLGVKQVETSIMWYSLSLCCLIFLASLGQVVILKRWFRNKPVKSPW